MQSESSESITEVAISSYDLTFNYEGGMVRGPTDIDRKMGIVDITIGIDKGYPNTCPVARCGLQLAFIWSSASPLHLDLGKPSRFKESSALHTLGGYFED